METSSILDEIEILVTDKLQVVSYKWLSRKYLLSSNTAKRLLQEFVETREKNFEAVFAIAGWLKSNPTCYQIKLVSASKLEETKQEYNGSCSVHVYSVQASIPKDSASLLDAEFVQAEELFRQPPLFRNCLRDNRFCGIDTPLVKRDAGGASSSDADSNAKISSAPPRDGLTKSSFEHGKLQQCNSVKTEKTEIGETKVLDDERKAALPAKRKINDDAKPAIAKGSSLANLWGRASAKSNPVGDAPPLSNSADAQILDCESVGDEQGDDDVDELSFRRTSGEAGRKRRVVFDSDDEFEESISLASPEQKRSRVAEESVVDDKSENFNKDSTLPKKTDQNSPKRKKIMKTRLDDRGREVIEVVFEGDGIALKKDEQIAAKANEINEINRSNSAPKKANSGAKAQSKKGSNKDPKQGNILSFFKKA